jgi:hypothetical protein
MGDAVDLAVSDDVGVMRCVVEAQKQSLRSKRRNGEDERKR